MKFAHIRGLFSFSESNQLVDFIPVFVSQVSVVIPRVAFRQHNKMPNDNAMDFDEIVETFVAAKVKFDSGLNPLEELREISLNSIALLIAECSKRPQGSLIGINRKSKDYFVFFKGTKPPTRPVRKDLYLSKNQLISIWNERLINEDFSGNAEEVANEINRASSAI